MRHASDIPMDAGGFELPPPGQYLCKCISAESGFTKKKNTKYLRLKFITRDGVCIQDDLYITGPALSRIMLVARRLCEMPADQELSDDDISAAEQAGIYILDRIEGRPAVITIEEVAESFVPTSGPNAGVPQTKARRRVAYGGYAAPEKTGSAPPPTPQAASAPTPAGDEKFEVADSEIPF